MDQNKYTVPQKLIKLPTDIDRLKKSVFFRDYITFICELQESVKSKKIGSTDTEQFKCKQKLAPLVDYMKKLSECLKEIPPIEQPMRFGNKAYKTWHEKAMSMLQDELFSPLLAEDDKDAAVELQVYFKDSFGSYERIDYGTGHELNFAIVLLFLKKLGYFDKEDYEYVVHHIFYEYIRLMREVQLLYKLEPAGSHGVWGLDDYHFLPFLFGASELIESKEVPTPNEILNQSVQQSLNKDYMYVDCIRFINEVKTGNFHEHSPILYDISGTPNWNKVAGGMVKMYQAEVVLKFPVIKHIAFGNVIKFD